MAGLPHYEVYAVRFSDLPVTVNDCFLGGDPRGDQPQTLTIYFWLVRGEDSTVLIDTGFHEDDALEGMAYLGSPLDRLERLDVDPDQLRDIVITHFHFDHMGNLNQFPGATFHVQEKEMEFATGKDMTHESIRGDAILADDVVNLVELLYDGRVQIHNGSAELAPGLSLHLVPGHTGGTQVVRVHTERGWVVLASDTFHLYEHFEDDRVFPVVYEVGSLLEGYNRLRELADSPQHLIPGHDPLVMEKYPPASPELEGIAARLDVEPTS